MSRAGKVALFLGAALWASAIAGGANASMGSLAPRNPGTTANAQQEWVTDPHTNCRALDADFDTGDAIQWQGACIGEMANGQGTLSYLNSGHVLETITGNFGNGALLPGHVSSVWSDGSKFDGSELNGQFEGAGNFVSATGDKISGEWKSGALNGNATVIWKNGDRYDGEWKDGKSDGEGTEIWANGDRFEGQWKDGAPVRQKSPGLSSAMAAPPAPETPPAATANHISVARETAPTPQFTSAAAAPQDVPAQASPAIFPIHDLIGKTLTAVDGSTITLDQNEGSLTRVVTLPSGVAQQTSFAFMNDRIGTVSGETAAIGLFRVNGIEIDTNYIDGKTEVMKPGTAGGIVLTSRSPDGNSACTAWYPEGHAFSKDEKKAAVEEYATRLGIDDASAPKKHHMAHAGTQTCGGGFVTNIATAGTAPAVPDSPPPVIQHSSALSESAAQGSSKSAARVQPIAVRDSTVHLIDAPYEPATAPPAIQNVKFGTDEIIPPAPSPVAVPPVSGAQSQSNASLCLSVANNGEYWGLQNRCGTVIQFAYCEMSDANPLTSCHHTSVSGSASANGFSALVNASSLSTQGADHEFRWMACDGGAGEVVPHLDSVDPPSGRCLRAIPAGSETISSPAGS
jgi:hypothetical protein